MKKLMFGLAAIAAGSVMAIESANVVGYQQFAGDWISSVGAAFKPVAAEGWTNETTVFGNDVATDDVVYMFNPEVWDLDYYQFAGFDGEGASLGWGYYTTDAETGEQVASVIKSFDTAKGDQIYFQPTDGISGLTIAGEVADTKGATVTIAEGEWIATLMNPYPVNTTLADLETFFKTDDVLYVFNPMVWDLDYYQFGGEGNGWGYYSTNPEDGEPTAELITDTSLVVLPAGVGGYIQPSDTDGRVWNVGL